MQIVGGRWEVCLGDGSCVLSFLSFPSARVNLYIMVQLCSPGPGPAPFPTDCWPEGALSSPPSVPARSTLQKRAKWPHLPSLTLSNIHLGILEILKS